MAGMDGVPLGRNYVDWRYGCSPHWLGATSRSRRWPEPGSKYSLPYETPERGCQTGITRWRNATDGWCYLLILSSPWHMFLGWSGRTHSDYWQTESTR